MKDLVTYVVEGLVDEPGQVEVRDLAGDQARILEVLVAPEDRGKLIGREGRTIRALRTLVAAAASRSGGRVVVDVLD